MRLFYHGITACNYLIKTVSPGSSTKIKYLGDPEKNAELAREEYQEGKTVLESLPPIITFALTTFCNNKIPCMICDRNTRPESGDSEVNRLAIEAAKPLLQTAKMVLLHCGGEAMLSKHFDEVISLINPPTKVSFATNAMLMTKKRADLMLEKDIMSDFVVSLDASTTETFKIMRPSSSFETILKNITYYTKRAKELKRDSNIKLNMTVCEANLKDVPGLVDIAVQVGATEVDYNHLNSGQDHAVPTTAGWDWDYKEQAKFTDKAFHDEMFMEAYRRAKKHDLIINFVGRPFIGPNAKKNEEIIEEMCGRVAFQETKE
ncbi:MAG: radical SAM protein, partial [Proteobacteria bacterium]|nr:radical SAM protein [Pseudomonadota bacterium]